MIEVETKSDFPSIEGFLKGILDRRYMDVLGKFGSEGVDALRAATPTETGVTASSWDYQIESSGSTATITWTNSHKHGNTNIAIILQYGHGTGTGGYVQGRDYINPAMRPVFDRIAKEAFKAVSSL